MQSLEVLENLHIYSSTSRARDQTNRIIYLVAGFIGNNEGKARAQPLSLESPCKDAGRQFSRLALKDVTHADRNMSVVYSFFFGH